MAQLTQSAADTLVQIDGDGAGGSGSPHTCNSAERDGDRCRHGCLGHLIWQTKTPVRHRGPG